MSLEGTAYSPTYNTSGTRSLRRATHELGNNCYNDRVRKVAFDFAFGNLDEDSKTVIQTKFGQQVFLKQIENLFNSSDESISILFGKIFQQAQKEIESFPKMSRGQLAIEYYNNTYPNFNWILDFLEVALHKSGYNPKYERHNWNWNLYMEDSLYVTAPYSSELYTSSAAIKEEIKSWAFIGGRIEGGKIPIALSPKDYRNFDWKVKRFTRSNVDSHIRQYMTRLSAFLNFPADEQAEPEDKIIIQLWLDGFKAFESLYRRAEKLVV
jgi:hypothetical protein